MAKKTRKERLKDLEKALEEARKIEKDLDKKSQAKEAKRIEDLAKALKKEKAKK
jgi:hypothetical protein